MRRSPLLLVAFALTVLGCPPKPPAPGQTSLPEEEKTPSPPEVKRPAPPSPEDEQPPAPVSSEAMTQMLKDAGDKGVVEALPKLKVFTREKRIEIEGFTAMKVGPQLELFACSPRGKAYESLLIWMCQPSHLHLALLMIGLTPTPQVGMFGEPGELKKGQKVVIEVEWTDKTTGKQVRRRAEDLLYDTYRDGCMKYAGWVFTGSRELDIPQPPKWETTKKEYAADVTGTVAVTYHDPDGILDTPLAEGGNNTTFVAWEQRLPDRHTPCITHIRAWRDGDDREPADALRAKNAERPTGGGPPGGGGGPSGVTDDDHDHDHAHDGQPGDKPK